MKKKITLLKVFMTLCLLLVGIGNACGETYTKATSIKAGDHVIFVCEKAKKELNGISTTSTKYGIGTDFTTSPAGTYSLDVVAGSETGTFSFKKGDNYLRWNSGNSLDAIATSVAKNSSWVITFDNSGNATIKNANDNSRVIWWNVSSPRFACYTGKTADDSYYAIQIYKKESTPVAVEAPTFTPTETEFRESTSVSLACATEGASIYYTLDGTEPTKTSTQYTETINISETTTIKAIAYKDGEASDVASKTYTKIVPLATMDDIFSASATAGNYWITFNNWVVSGVKGSNAYITDNVGKGLIVYKSSHGFVAGDILSGTVKCALTRYNGSAEITDLTSSAAGLAVTKGGTLNTIDATIANLGGVNTGAYINLGALTYNGTDFSDGTNTIKPYNTFITLPTLANGKKYYVKGVYIQFNNTKEIAPLTNADFAEVPTTEYNINIADGIQNGTVSADMEKAAEGVEVTLTINPEQGYKLGTLTVKDATEADVTVIDNKFKMPASDVYVSATFEAIPTHTAKFFVNGVQYGETQDVYEGGEVEFPEEDPAAIGTRSFVGWTASPMSGVSDEAPKFEKSATMGTKDLNFYAVYAKKTEVPVTWNKVTTLAGITEGTYVLVSEKTANTYKYMPNTESSGSNPTLGGGITINNDVLTNEVTDEMLWSLVSTGTTNEYYIRPYGDDGIGLGTTNSTGANIRISSLYKDTKWTIAANEKANWQIKNNNTTEMYLAVYADDAWRNYSNATTNQNGKFYFFRKSGGTTYSGYCTDVPVTATITSTGYATFSCDYALDLGKLPAGLTAYFATYNEKTNAIHMEVATGKVPAKTGLFLGGNKSTQYDIPVTADDAVAPANNILKPTGEEDLVAGDFVYYISSEKFCPITNETLTLSAGKAYIPKAEIPAEGPVSIVFGGEITGIEGVGLTPALSTREGVIYNLQGMRVTTPKKGEVYIMNGKKCIMK